MTLFAQFDVAMPRDPRMIASGPLGRMLYVQCVLYCRENLTDGVIDALLLPLVAIDIPSPKKHMARLAEVGALEVIPTGWRIPSTVWRKWNPLAAEVAEKRDAETERKRQWKERNRDKPTDTTATTSRRADSERRDRQPEPEPEPEQNTPVISQMSQTEPVDNSAGGENPSTVATRRQQIIDHHVRIATDQAEATGTTINRPTAWAAAVATRCAGNPDLDRWAQMFPTAPADAIAAWLHGDKGSMRYYPRTDELATVTELYPNHQEPTSA